MVVIASSRRGGLSCTPFCTSFLDGLKLFIYFVYLLLQAYRFIMTLSRFAKSLSCTPFCTSFLDGLELCVRFISLCVRFISLLV